MKSIWKFLNILTLILLAAFLGLRDVLPVSADAPFQTITVLTHAPLTAADGESFTVDAEANSGLTVTYSASGVCTNVDATFTMTSDSGTCFVYYDQAGDTNYDPAPQETDQVTAQPANTATPTETETPTATASPSPTGTMTATETETPTETASPSPTGTMTETMTATVTLTPTITATPGPVTLYVSTAGDDGNTCKSPTETCLTIPSALAKAIAGDTIKVAVGTYSGVTIIINKNITLLGGWDASFTTQSGLSTLDGQNNHLVLLVSSIATVEKFIMQNGVQGIQNSGNLTLKDSIVRNNTHIPNGGLYGTGGIGNSSGTITIYNSVITGNGSPIAGQHAFGGINSYQGTVTIYNSKINNNSASSLGGGVYGHTSTITISNSTISDNLSGNGGGIYIDYAGTATLNNTTIARNTAATSGGGIGTAKGQAVVRLNNSIIAENIAGKSEVDCYGKITNLANSLIGNTTGCTVVAQSGSIIDVKAQIGRTVGTGYIPLLLGSPAINAGNPATCSTANDARNLPRPQGSACDMGSYEYKAAGAAVSMTYVSGSDQTSRIGISYAAPLAVYLLDSIGSPVKGVLITFTAPASGPSGTFQNSKTNITIVATDSAGFATTSIFTANNKPGSYKVNASANGLPNPIKFQLTNLPIPTPLTPTGITPDLTPTYQWTKVVGATMYQYQAWKGSTLLYTNTVPSSVCNTTTCSATPATLLQQGNANYKWRVQAMLGGVWQSYSEFKSFMVLFIPKAGLWKGPSLEFYATPDRLHIEKFAIYVYVGGCGYYKITHTAPATVANGKFSFTGSFYAKGTIDNDTNAHGELGLYHFYLLNCGTVSGGPFSWTATWKNGSQPTVIQAEVVPMPVGSQPDDSPTYFTVERVVGP